MIRGLYSAATGMIAQQFVQDSLANNLANANTVGFKQDVATFHALRAMALNRYQNDTGRGGAPVGEMGLGAAFDRAVTDLSPGPIMHTGNSFDLALLGSGFFAVQTPQGERYTRAGQFHLEPAGKAPDGKLLVDLVDEKGRRVLGRKGPIRFTDPKQVSVDGRGNVSADGVLMDQLKIVDAPASALTKEGNSLFSVRGATAASTATVRQGYLEQSNVSAIGSMVRMITVQRAYEAAQRAVTAQDDTLGKAVNEIGRI